MTDEVLIVGGGIGGLVTALSLHQAGVPVRVYEAVPRIEPLGVGINLLPHAVREMEELDLRRALEADGVLCRELAYYTKRGQRIWSEPRGEEAGYRWPQISIHRGALQMVLLRAALERVGEDRIHLGHRVAQVESDAGVVEVTLEDPSGRSLGRAQGALLVAADGIHSSVRRQFYPDEGPPRWNGAIMWRGVADAPPYLDGRTMIMAGHPELKFVCYPISNAGARPGHRCINFIAEKRVPVSDDATPEEREDWTRRAHIDDFLPLYEDWTFDWLDVPALIRATDAVWIYPMVDRDPLPRWTFGRATLLGDAAHPMYPIGSNGASQAILDARALTGCLLAHPGDVERALERYEADRRPATARIVTANRGMGPELPMQLVEERAPDGFERLQDVISDEELSEIADGYKRVAGFAVESLNARASLADPQSWREP
ncbi:MAG: flavin-dependent oxidoreductase [Myxococcales bacterium]|nr:flavin-dependent oxidoreductase [Myxococcales bacterium]